MPMHATKGRACIYIYICIYTLVILLATIDDRHGSIFCKLSSLKQSPYPHNFITVVSARLVWAQRASRARKRRARVRRRARGRGAETLPLRLRLHPGPSMGVNRSADEHGIGF